MDDNAPAHTSSRTASAPTYITSLSADELEVEVTGKSYPLTYKYQHATSHETQTKPQPPHQISSTYALWSPSGQLQWFSSAIVSFTKPQPPHQEFETYVANALQYPSGQLQWFSGAIVFFIKLQPPPHTFSTYVANAIQPPSGQLVS